MLPIHQFLAIPFYCAISSDGTDISSPEGHTVFMSGVLIFDLKLLSSSWSLLTVMLLAGCWLSGAWFKGSNLLYLYALLNILFSYMCVHVY